MGKEKSLEKESSHTSFTDDLLINMLLELIIGGIIFYFSYVYYISTLSVSIFLELCLLVFFSSISTIISSIIAYPITKYISKKAQHEKKGFRDLHPQINFQYILTFVFNLILTAILIMLGFYIYISVFLENQTIDIAILVYLTIKLFVIVFSSLFAYLIMKLFKTENKKTRFKGYILVISLITIYIIMIIFAIMFIFLE
jgi:hypothetical protein